MSFGSTPSQPKKKPPKDNIKCRIQLSKGLVSTYIILEQILNENINIISCPKQRKVRKMVLEGKWVETRNLEVEK